MNWSKSNWTGKIQDSVYILLYLLCGICGILSLFRGVNGVRFSGLKIYGHSVIFCTILWLLWNCRRGNIQAIRWNPKTGWLFCFLLFFVYGRKIFSIWQDCVAQGIQIFLCLSGKDNPSLVSVNEFLLVFSLVLVSILFLFAFSVESHGIPYLLTTMLLFFAPLLRIRISAETLLLMIIYQAVFWTVHLSDPERLGLIRKSSIITAGFILCLFFCMGWIFSRFDPQIFFQPVYRLEGFAIRSLQTFSGQEINPIINGWISRSNTYHTGDIQFTIAASQRPTEALYLGSYSGEEYADGNWSTADTRNFLENMLLEDTPDKNVSPSQLQNTTTLYYNLYRDITKYQDRPQEPLPEAIRMAIYPADGEYTNHLLPYFSQWVNWSDNHYSYIYYERHDIYTCHTAMQDYLKARTPEFLQMSDRIIQQIHRVYTRVPEKSLPRLSALVRENPLQDLDDITAFILHTLHNNAVYTTTPGWFPLNQDVSEYFLFEGRQGYCVHFASTAALLYRLYGVPARYVAGYMVEPAAFEQHNDQFWTASITDEAAHAWVEIFLPDFGWIPVEVTPAAGGSSQDFSYPGLQDQSLTSLWQSRHWSVPVSRPQNLSGTDLHLSTPTEQHFPTRSPESLSGQLSPDEIRQDMIITLGTCLLFFLMYLPVFLDYRRARRLARLKQANCRIIFTRILDMLHDCGQLQDFDGSETDFPQKLASVSGASSELTEKLLADVHRIAYGPEIHPVSENHALLPESSIRAETVYLVAASTLYRQLRWYKKLIFHYIWAY